MKSSSNSIHPCFFKRFLLFALCVVCFILPHHVFAAIDTNGIGPDETVTTNPKSRTVSVTASVHDTIPPSIPILISPENGSTTNIQKFPFIWHQSSDDQGIKKYQLFLNGSLYTDNLTTSFNGPFTYTELAGIATLQLDAGLSDGTYTWKIRVYDNNDNYSDSATWTFTIASTAPTLVITQIGDQIVSISSQDSSTIPASPIILTENQPIVTGTTKANITVQITYTLPSGISETFETTSDDNGMFSVTLPVLPRNTIITVDALARDSIGNISVISGIKIEIVAKTILLPQPFNELVPPIPVPPPVQEIQRAVQQYVEQMVQTLPQPIVTLIHAIAPYINLLLGIVLPLLAIIVVIWKAKILVYNLAPAVIASILRALGFLPKNIPSGVVMHADTRAPIPFAHVRIVDASNFMTIAHSISDKHGVCWNLSVDTIGEFLAVSDHRSYAFPTTVERSRFSTLWEFYKGEVFPLHEFQTLPTLFFPMDAETNKQESKKLYWFAKFPNLLVVPISAILTGFALIYPTPWNIVMAVLYGCALGRRVVRTVTSPNLVGTIVDASALPLSNAWVLANRTNDVALQTITHTDNTGEFELHVPKDQYRMTYVAHGYTTKETLVDLREQSQAVAISLS